MTADTGDPARAEAAGRIAVGVSGTGSNLRALAAAAARGELGGRIVLVFADRACPALDWAVEQGIDTALVPDGTDEAVRETLVAAGPDLVVLAGYMRIVGPVTLEAFESRILNTHPSLLPAFPGARAVADAIAHGAKVTGATVHLVTPELDAGPIVVQAAVPVHSDDTVDSLSARILVEEHRIYPEAVRTVLDGRWQVEGRRFTVLS